MAEDNTWKQKTLQPRLLEETDPSYHAVIDLQHALEDDRNRNIALTGPFGAGKSSVIYTLRNKEEVNKKWKFLSISLATLDATYNITDQNEPQTEDESQTEDKSQTEGKSQTKKHTPKPKIKDIDNEQLNRKIEYSILQQLIYREKSETLPNSRLKRIPYLSKETIHKISLNILLFIRKY